MIRSDEIQETFARYAQPVGPEMTPYIYGHNQGYSYNMTDPYLYGAADKFGGHVAGAAGISLLGGVVGGSLGFSAMMGGLRGGWRGLTTVRGGGSRWQAFKTATGFMAKAGVAGRALPAALLGGAMAAAPAYLAAKAVEYAGENIYAGARYQQDVNRIAGRYMRFQNMSNSILGYGASIQEKRGIADMLIGMERDDTLRSKEELTRIMDKLGQRNFFQDVTSVDNFKKKFKQTVDTLKHMAKTFGSTLEEAIPLLDIMKHSGIYTASAQRAMSTRIRLSGMNMKEASAAMGMGSQISRSVGGDLQSGAMGAFSFQNMLNFAQTNLKQKDASRITRLMSEITGGKQGMEARLETTQRMMGATANFLYGPLGRMALAGLVNDDFTGLDQSKIEQLQSGKLSLSKLTSLGLSNTASMRNKARFINREDDLRGAFLKQGGPMLMAALIRSAMTSGILQGSNDADIQEIIMKRFGFGDRRMAQLATTLVKNLPEMRTSMNRNAIRQAGNLVYQQQYADTYSFGAMSTRFFNSIGRAFSTPFQEIGRGIYNGSSDLWRNLFRPAGVAQAYVGRKDIKALISGDFGGLDMSDLSNRDLQRVDNRGWISRTMSRWAEQLAGTRQDDGVGSFIGEAFSKEQLFNLGMRQVNILQLRKNDTILYRMDSKGKVMQRMGQDAADQMVMAGSQKALSSFMQLEQRRASGKAALDVMDKVIGGNKYMKHSMNMLTNHIRDAITLDPVKMRRFRDATPAQRRAMLRELVRERYRKDKGTRDVVDKNMYIKGRGISFGEGALRNSIDDLVATADAQLKSRGIDLGVSYATGGGDASLVDAASRAEKLLDTATQKLSSLGGYTFVRNGQSIEQNILQEDFKQMKHIFGEENAVSSAVMKHLTFSKRSNIDKDIISRIQTAKDSIKIEDVNLSADDVKRLQRMLRTDPTSMDRAKQQEAFQEWKRAISLSKTAAFMGQVKNFGDLGFSDLKKIGGVARDSIKSMFYRMQQGFRTKEEARRALVDGDILKDVIRDVSSITDEQDRDRYIAQLGGAGETGKAISRSLRIYFDKIGKDGKGDMKGAMRHLRETLFSAGYTNVTDKSASMKETLTVWNDYVRANQQFIQAVAVVLKDKNLDKAAAAMSRKTKTVK